MPFVFQFRHPFHVLLLFYPPFSRIFPRYLLFQFLQFPHSLYLMIFLRYGWNTPILIPDQIMPFVLFAFLKHRFRCIKTVCQHTHRQSWVFLFQTACQTVECPRFTVILFCIFSLIFYKFCPQADDKPFP